MGAMQALGVLFQDESGAPVEGNGAGLANVAKIDTSNLYEGIKRSKITIMCDVTNPLTGPDGACGDGYRKIM